MRAIIFSNGVMGDWPADFKMSPAEDLIIAADGGLTHCLAWGATPHVVIGDLDSADPADLKRMHKQGVEIIRYPAGKNETDLELALRLAVDRGMCDIAILAALGARWDMTISSVMILSAPYLAGTRVRLLDGRQEMQCLRGGRNLEVSGAPGDRVSIIPIAGDAAGVSLKGLEYPLTNATLTPAATRGLSNVLVNHSAQIRIERGCLLVVVTRRTQKRIQKRGNH